MKITLLKPHDDGVIDDKIDLPFSLLILGTIIERARHEVSIIELETNDVEKIEFAEIFGITSVTSTFSASMKLAKDLRRKFPDSRVFMGGKHFWATSQDIAGDGIVVFTGESDEVILPALDDTQRQIWHSDAVQDMDSIYPLAFHLVELENPHRRKFNGKTCVSMGLSRGCPHKCTFCHNRHRSLRCIKPETFKKEVAHLEQKGLEALYLFDDNFLAFPHLDKYLDVCRDSNFSILCLGRADTLSKGDLAKTLKASNIDALHIGIESGSARQLRIMQKNLSPDIIRLGLNKAIDAGLSVQISLIVGFPGEDWGSIEETVSLLKDIPFRTVSLFPFIPFPGCDVWRNPDKYDITYIDEDFSKFRLLDKDGNPSFVYETKKLDRKTLHAMWNYLSAVFDNRIKHRDRKPRQWELYDVQ